MAAKSFITVDPEVKYFLMVYFVEFYPFLTFLTTVDHLVRISFKVFKEWIVIMLLKVPTGDVMPKKQVMKQSELRQRLSHSLAVWVMMP
jgi:hypothetical protein